MTRFLRSIVALIALTGVAYAQPVGQLPSGRVWGNPGASQAIASAATMTAMLDRAFCTTQNAALYRNATTWVCLASANNGVWITSGAGVPSISSSLPNAVQLNIDTVGTVTTGIWDATAVAVTAGGTGLESGTSGGIPYFNTATTMASSGVLGSGQIVLGGGAGGAPTVLSCATTTTVVHGGAPPTCSQVSLTTDVTGQLPLGNIADIADDRMLANVSGGAAAPAATTFTQWMDAVCSGTQGALAYRGAASWSCLAVGSATQALIGGTEPAWGAVPLTAIATIADGTVLSNISGGAAVPSANSLTAILDDAFSATQGAVLYRGAAGWSSLGPGTLGQVFSSGGPAADPTWETVAGTGTVTEVTCGTGLTGGTFTDTGTCAIDKAAQSDAWAATSNKVATTDILFNSAGAMVTLAGTTTVTPDFSTGFNFEFTATSATNYTLANPTNTKVGQQGCIYLIQPASGTVVTISYGGNWKTTGGVTGKTLTATLGAVDRICYLVRSSSFIDFSLAKDIKS